LNLKELKDGKKIRKRDTTVPKKRKKEQKLKKEKRIKVEQFLLTI